MSLCFFYEIFFFEAVVLDIVTALTQVGNHPFHGAGAAAEAFGYGFNGAEPVLIDEFEDISQPLFVRKIIHLISRL